MATSDIATDEKEPLRIRLAEAIERNGIDIDELSKLAGLADSIGVRSFLRGNLKRVGIDRLKTLVAIAEAKDGQRHDRGQAQGEPVGDAAAEQADPVRERRMPRRRRAPAADVPAQPVNDAKPEPAAEQPATAQSGRRAAAPSGANAQRGRRRPTEPAPVDSPEASPVEPAPVAIVPDEPVEEILDLGPAGWAAKWSLTDDDYQIALVNGLAAPRAKIGRDIHVQASAYWVDGSGRTHAADYLVDRDVLRKSTVFCSDDRQAMKRGDEYRELRVTEDRAFVVRLVMEDGSVESCAVDRSQACRLFGMTCKNAGGNVEQKFDEFVTYALDQGRPKRNY